VIPAVVLDTSAWGRLQHPGLEANRSEELAAAAVDGRLIVSIPFLLEAGYTAHDGAEHGLMLARLLEFPRLHLDAEIEDRAIDAQSRLARVGHHRLPPSDVLIAALADRHGVGVLHYDHRFDLIAEKTGLAFDSVWLAEPGSL
jgi:predicted nucleic acid-binding protein